MVEWTEEDIEYIKKTYLNETIKNIAKKLNKSTWQVYEKARSLGLTNKLIEKTCLWCGKKFTTKNKKKIFCNELCCSRFEYHKCSLKEQYPPYKICIYCGKKYYYKDNKKDFARMVTCGSTECKNKLNMAIRAKYESTEKGKEYMKRKRERKNIRYKRWRQELKEKVLDKIGKKCFVCGFDKVIDIHHISGREGHSLYDDLRKRMKTGNLLGLVVLCPNHHSMIHRGVAKLEKDNEKVKFVMLK